MFFVKVVWVINKKRLEWRVFFESEIGEIWGYKVKKWSEDNFVGKFKYVINKYLNLRVYCYN